ncbi:UNVERIFIED_ORG: hypothetical protein J2W87_005011 [Pseudomonas putida]|nr:hypothetical protein [Pseudomonas putida]
MIILLIPPVAWFAYVHCYKGRGDEPPSQRRYVRHLHSRPP